MSQNNENNKNINSLKDIINKHFSNFFSQDLFKLRQIKENWNKITGDLCAKHSMPAKVNNNKLTVITDDVYWNAELVNLKYEIIENIKKITKIEIKDLKFQLGTIKPDITIDKIETIETLISKEELEFIENKLKSIEDENLRNALKKYYILCNSQNKNK